MNKISIHSFLFVGRLNFHVSIQDSSLGSFEGEPGVSSESLSDIPGNYGEQRLSRRHRQRPLTALDSGSHTPTSLYAQVDLKKKKRPPSGYLSRHLGKTKSVDPVTMTTSLSGLEVRSVSIVRKIAWQRILC